MVINYDIHKENLETVVQDRLHTIQHQGERTEESEKTGH